MHPQLLFLADGSGYGDGSCSIIDSRGNVVGKATGGHTSETERFIDLKIGDDAYRIAVTLSKYWDILGVRISEQKSGIQVNLAASGSGWEISGIQTINRCLIKNGYVEFLDKQGHPLRLKIRAKTNGTPDFLLTNLLNLLRFKKTKNYNLIGLKASDERRFILPITLAIRFFQDGSDFGSAG